MSAKPFRREKTYLSNVLSRHFSEHLVYRVAVYNAMLAVSFHAVILSCNLGYRTVPLERYLINVFHSELVKNSTLYINQQLSFKTRFQSSSSSSTPAMFTPTRFRVTYYEWESSRARYIAFKDKHSGSAGTAGTVELYQFASRGGIEQRGLQL